MKRCSGLFLHPTSLPSQYGIGDLGDDAYRWIDLLKKYNQHLWQLCPIGPTGFGNSPYMSLSSSAGNPLLISPLKLFTYGLVTKEEIDTFPQLPDTYVDYQAVTRAKEILFHNAFKRFEGSDEFESFCRNEAYWLDDYVLFVVIKQKQNGLPWYSWERDLRLREPDALKKMQQHAHEEIRYRKFLQFMFHRQWSELKSYAHTQGIILFGDIPYYIAYDSCDTWSSPHLFELDKNGKVLRVGGVPPDYFSKTGQLWGNPIYRWKLMKKNNYAWWIQRIKKTLTYVDWIRIDHFRGFVDFWAVPAENETAVHGEWEKGPGIDIFKEIYKQLGKISLIAEDLGMITDKVYELRDKADIPGMKVLQFAFDKNPKNPYLPYNITNNSVVYTGTHDNDTSIGWFVNLPPADKQYICRYLGCDDMSFIQSFIRAAMSSTADICIIPLQDALWLDGSHRMNTPGTGDGNWQWRFTNEMIEPYRLELLHEFTGLYGR